MDDLLADELDYTEAEPQKKYGFGFDLSCFEVITEFPKCNSNPYQTDPVQRNINKVQLEQQDFNLERFIDD